MFGFHSTAFRSSPLRSVLEGTTLLTATSGKPWHANIFPGFGDWCCRYVERWSSVGQLQLVSQKEVTYLNSRISYVDIIQHMHDCKSNTIVP
jgi:hypothetical protein